MSLEIDSHCPLCAANVSEPAILTETAAKLTLGGVWHYYHCATCDLIFRNRESYLSVPEEQARYALHDNAAQADLENPDMGYLDFLRPTADVVSGAFRAPAQGLDFGCGPGPLLARHLSKQGFEMRIFDPLFFNDGEVLTRKYNFVTCTEVVEHLRHPAFELKLMASLLKPGGRLIVQTALHSQSAFATWHYRRDPTHICFFSEKTWRWWSQKNQFDLVFPARNVAVMTPTNGTI